MAQYIDKAAVVAEIERIKENTNKRGYIGKCSVTVVCNELLSFLNTLEVKEVDLEKEIKEFLSSEEYDKARGGGNYLIAKHFFELGLKTAKKEGEGR